VKEIEDAVEDLLQALETNLNPGEAVGIVKSFQSKLLTLKNKLTGFFSFGQSDKQNIQAILPEITREKVTLEGKFRLVLSERAGLAAGISMKQKQLQELEQKYLDTSLELDKTDLSKVDTLAQEIGDQQQAIEKDLDHISGEVQKLEGLLSSFDLEAKTRREGLSQLEGNLRDLQVNQDRLQEILSQLQIEGAKIETQLQMLEKEILDFFGENELSLIRVQAIPATTPELEIKIAKLRSSLEQIGGVDEMTLQEYSETESRYTNLTSQVADLKKGMEDLRKIMDELDEHIHEKFNVAFHKVNEHFEQYFRVLFSGGRANLSLVKNHSDTASESEQENLAEDTPDGLRPEEKLVKSYEEQTDTVVGIDIKATPPGKKLASVQALSGGERALTAIALLCSLLTCFPSPFVVLDEVDAALDEANTVRFGQILGSLAHQTQFVTITHNRETMAQSSTLYGVTMGDDGVSKILSIKFDQATEYAKS
jgi:chromosome segregation protein